RQIFVQNWADTFVGLVLHNVADHIAATFNLKTNKPDLLLLRPMLEGALRVESLASFGGVPGQPFDGVMAFHLKPDEMQLWRKNFKGANTTSAEPLQANGFSGWQWSKGTKNA